MRRVSWHNVVEAVSGLCVAACHELDALMCEALARGREKETSSSGKNLLGQLLDNATIAREERIPLCQDTGVTLVWVKQGRDCWVAGPEGDDEATLSDAINEGVRLGYEQGYLRKSMVADPLADRRNTQTNTPAIIYHEWSAGESLELTVMAKGGGCENRSAFKMFKPTAGADEVEQFIVDTALAAGADSCPPFVVGVGIGGTFDYSAYLSKKALLRDIGQRHNTPFYAKMEASVLERLNASGIGPGGLGGATTALAVMIETFPCHIASLPVSVTMECHAHRHKHVVL